MSVPYVTAPPTARTEGDVMWLDLKSGSETLTFALTRNAAVYLLRAVMAEARGPLFDNPDCVVVPLKTGRKNSSKKAHTA
jgi:hypothetical protein